MSAASSTDKTQWATSSSTGPGAAAERALRLWSSRYCSLEQQRISAECVEVHSYHIMLSRAPCLPMGKAWLYCSAVPYESLAYPCEVLSFFDLKPCLLFSIPRDTWIW